MKINPKPQPQKEQPATARKMPMLTFYASGSLLDVPDALAHLGIPDTPAARAWIHDQFAPMRADEFWVIPRAEIEEFCRGYHCGNFQSP
jgi:hypothetical protein